MAHGLTFGVKKFTEGPNGQGPLSCFAIKYSHFNPPALQSKISGKWAVRAPSREVKGTAVCPLKNAFVLGVVGTNIDSKVEMTS